MFLNEILENLGLAGVVKNNYLILNYSGLGVYIQGSVLINFCSSVKIELSISGSFYTILGENLDIKNMTKDTLYISGKIQDILKGTFTKNT